MNTVQVLVAVCSPNGCGHSHTHTHTQDCHVQRIMCWTPQRASRCPHTQRLRMPDRHRPCLPSTRDYPGITTPGPGTWLLPSLMLLIILTPCFGKHGARGKRDAKLQRGARQPAIRKKFSAPSCVRRSTQSCDGGVHLRPITLMVAARGPRKQGNAEKQCQL